MSWQGYLQTLTASGLIPKAAIISLQGGILASTPGYSISPEEQEKIVRGFTDPNQVLVTGVYLHGVKFLSVKANHRSIYGRTQGEGCALVKTKQAVLVAEFTTPKSHIEKEREVENVADHMIGDGH